MTDRGTRTWASDPSRMGERTPRKRWRASLRTAPICSSCDGLVVDFSAFTHPGGRSVLTRHAGEDVSDMFRGIAGTRTSSHKPMAHMGSDAHAHSAAAFSMLTRLAVGTIDDATAASETGAESDGPFARVRARRAQLVMHTGAEGADTAVDDEKGEVASGAASGPPSTRTRPHPT